MRLMSFALTTAQLLDGSKTVTRRVGWERVKPGDRIKAVRKAMGLKKGEKPEVLAVIEVVSARRERLDAIDEADCIAEGFPLYTPDEFTAMFCAHAKVQTAMAGTRKMQPHDLVTRIEFRHVEVQPRSARGRP